jgi:ADP-ribosylglycohydrolase
VYAAALWAVANSRNFDELLVKSIHHSGDSDSVAAIAGSIWGLCSREIKYVDRLQELAPINYITDRIDQWEF